MVTSFPWCVPNRFIDLGRTSRASARHCAVPGRNRSRRLNQANPETFPRWSYPPRERLDPGSFGFRRTGRRGRAVVDPVGDLLGLAALGGGAAGSRQEVVDPPDRGLDGGRAENGILQTTGVGE